MAVHRAGRSSTVGWAIFDHGVYGDSRGRLVDERHPPHTIDKARACPGSNGRGVGGKCDPDCRLQYLSFGGHLNGPGRGPFAKVRGRYGAAESSCRRRCFPASTSKTLPKRLSCHCKRPECGAVYNLLATTTPRRLRCDRLTQAERSACRPAIR